MEAIVENLIFPERESILQFSVVTKKVLLDVLGYMDIHDIPSVACVCKIWRNALEEFEEENAQEFWLGLAWKHFPDIVEIWGDLQHPKKSVKELMERRVRLLHGTEQGMFAPPNIPSSYHFIVEIRHPKIRRRRDCQSVVVSNTNFNSQQIQLDVAPLQKTVSMLSKFQQEFRLIVYIVRMSGGQAKIFDQTYDMSYPDESREGFLSINMATIIGDEDEKRGSISGNLELDGAELNLSLDGSWCPWGDEFCVRIADLLSLDVGFD